jgi:tetratricopeptide (TPR) repeat protein
MVQSSVLIDLDRQTQQIKRRVRDIERALQDCNVRIKLNKGDCEALMARGSLWLRRGEKKAALELFCPCFLSSLLCACIASADSLEQAREDFLAVMKLKPEYSEVYYLLGVVSEKEGSLDIAITYFTQALHLDPAHAKAAYARGACHNMKGNIAQALGKFVLSLQLLNYPT